MCPIFLAFSMYAELNLHYTLLVGMMDRLPLPSFLLPAHALGVLYCQLWNAEVTGQRKQYMNLICELNCELINISKGKSAD